MSARVLEIADLTVRYGGNRVLAVDGLSLGAGEVVGVVGANGAGKSTLVNATLGWSRGKPVVSGRVLLDGKDVSALPTPRRVAEGLLLIPEGKLIFGTMTVEENLAEGATDPGPDRRAYSAEDVYSLFPRLKERGGHLGSQLSGGERQMLGIGRALRLAPKALLLDEPSIGLAPKLVSTVLHTVRELCRDGLSVLLVEQNVKAAIAVVDRMILLERGRIVLEGTAGEMRDNPRIAEAYLGTQQA
ncbi:ATP-binding cassette domain-containing protein [Limibaculum sp. M0105]|uniref:ATP-binding cassette domain-containing protein n=1 Tax=Thermohalobaculum xanthum TaxID=2753746 RepID=A0A8J7M4L1_9RHOB|nr:ATP-binding cassette domain-containing protein [Thermohalobaculum xanthum]MBK0398196.1 ATP-binding cassette domain-containing protein [Thermohalobaculum xanthum]